MKHSREKLTKKTNFSVGPNLVRRNGGILGCGCHPLFINAREKLTKETDFSTDPHLVKRNGGIIGWGCHPLFY